MNVFEHIILTKKRSNSKKWELTQREYSNELINLDETPKQSMVVYVWQDAPSIEAIKEFNAKCDLIVMSNLGAKSNVRYLSYPILLADSANAHINSVTNKRTVIAHVR